MVAKATTKCDSKDLFYSAHGLNTFSVTEGTPTAVMKVLLITPPIFYHGVDKGGVLQNSVCGCLLIPPG